MNIVLEGIDSTGKSTLARWLTDNVFYPFYTDDNQTWYQEMLIVEGAGPPKSDEEMYERVKRYLAYDNVIFDRHPCVSDPIYQWCCNQEFTSIPDDQISRFYSQNNFIIYCDPTTLPMEGHIETLSDTSEHVCKVTLHYGEILADYRDWAGAHAHVIYRVGMPFQLIEEYFHAWRHAALNLPHS